MWTKPGDGYSYSSPSPHVASIVLRHLVGMEMQQYIEEKLAEPMGLGAWGYALHRGDNTCRTRQAEATSPCGPPMWCACLPDPAPGQVGQPATGPGRLRRDVRQAVALQSPFADEPDVRGQRRRPRVRRASRCVFQVGRGRVGDFDRPLARPGDLQNGRQRRAVQSGADRNSAQLRVRSLAR